MFSVYANLTIA